MKPVVSTPLSRSASRCRQVLLFVEVALVFGLCACSHRQESGEESERIPPQASSEAGRKLAPLTVRMTVEAQQALGLEVKSVRAATLLPRVKGYGRVLDPRPLVQLAAELLSTQAAYAASRQEYDRLAGLRAQNNASTRDFQTARASAESDRQQALSLSNQLALAWGDAIAGHTNLESWVQMLATHRESLVRVDLPAGEALTNSPAGATLTSLRSPPSQYPVRLLGPAPTTDPELQGQGFLFLLQTNAASLVPGTAVIAQLDVGEKPLSGFTLPDSAVVRHEGSAWVYVQKDATTFQRTRVRLDRPTANGWFVREGLSPGDRLVTSGTQALLSEELKAGIQMSD